MYDFIFRISNLNLSKQVLYLFINAVYIFVVLLPKLTLTISRQIIEQSFILHNISHGTKLRISNEYASHYVLQIHEEFSILREIKAKQFLLEGFCCVVGKFSSLYMTPTKRPSGTRRKRVVLLRRRRPQKFDSEIMNFQYDLFLSFKRREPLLVHIKSFESKILLVFQA